MRPKRYHGAAKTAATRVSFLKKLEHMSRVLATWQTTGKSNLEFWPSSLNAFKKWESEAEGIFAWSSNNVTRKDGLYGDLVAQYWSLQERASSFRKGTRRDREHETKELNRVLLSQNASLLWSVMELRDALSRVDPKNEALARLAFP